MASLIPAGAGLLFGGLSSLFGARARQRQDKEKRKALVGAAEEGETNRLTHARGASELLRGLATPSAAYGGNITGAGQLSPEALEALLARRNVKPGAIAQGMESGFIGPQQGAGSAFASGLFGGLRDFAGRMGGVGGGLGGGRTLQSTGALPQAEIPDAGPATSIDWDALLREQAARGGGGL